VRPSEVVGTCIWYYGIFDLTVSEAIARLLDPSETALDIGANIGQMTTLMSRRTGPGGQVFSFEPHPDIFADLSANARAEGARPASARIHLHNIGLSDHAGESLLQLGPCFENNRGIGRVAVGGPEPGTRSVPIRLDTLDQVLPAGTQVGVCKIDVEGHELQVFQGAQSLLGRRAIRDVIFEDLDPYPSPLQRFLLGQGFTLFSIHMGWWGPRLALLDRQPRFLENREGENYLATLDPERALRRFGPRGWRALGRVG
jgi:FkbM family methyltransferase